MWTLETLVVCFFHSFSRFHVWCLMTSNSFQGCLLHSKLLIHHWSRSPTLSVTEFWFLFTVRIETYVIVRMYAIASTTDSIEDSNWCFIYSTIHSKNVTYLQDCEFECKGHSCVVALTFLAYSNILVWTSSLLADASDSLSASAIYEMICITLSNKVPPQKFGSSPDSKRARFSDKKWCITLFTC